MNHQPNLVIQRKFDVNGKNSWTIDGKKVNEVSQVGSIFVYLGKGFRHPLESGLLYF
jgi:hypothetical protein